MATARTASIRRRFSASLLLGGSALLLFGVVAPVADALPAAKPAGNNGTIKIDGTEFDTHPDNQPHVGCIFQVDFYGFDATTAVTMEFEVQPPTGDAVIYTENGVLDNDDNSGGGSEAGLDGQFTIDLSSGLAPYTPHPQQGYHVQLTVTADDGDETGAQVKHKTFWVEGCDEAPTTTEATTTTAGPTTTTAGPTTTTAGPTTTTAGPTTTETPTTQAIAGTGTNRATTTLATQDTVAGRQITRELPRTGEEDRSMIFLGLAFILAGIASLVLQRGRLSRS